MGKDNASEVKGGRRTHNHNKKQQQQHQAKKKSNGTNDNANNNSKNRAKNDSPKPSHKQQQKPYPEHWSLEQALAAYAKNQEDKTVIRGTIRVLPFGPSSANTSKAFVTCDRGTLSQDVLILGQMDRNRALDGDEVYVELIGRTTGTENKADDQEDTTKEEEEAQQTLWQDDPMQLQLWDPRVPIALPRRRILRDAESRKREKEQKEQSQPTGRVVCIVPPKPVLSELPEQKQQKIRRQRRLVGTLRKLPQPLVYLFTPNNKSLPQFKCHTGQVERALEQQQKKKQNQDEDCDDFDFRKLYVLADYEYGSWKTNQKWPPCINVKVMGETCNIEDEIQALLIEYNANHGDFSPHVLKDVDAAVRSGLYDPTNEKSSKKASKSISTTADLGWAPTPDMYEDRRDYRTSRRIFTIDPTTAKDLDDALHILELPDGTIELGVHIADVSFFVQPGSAVDREAQHRATTVYLVDRTVPMLPRPLCEVACSLNENVERLAFSCVWRMHRNGTLVHQHPVWYGRTVIRSCARLDYATAQNIIEGKVDERHLDETLWPTSRRPTAESNATVAQVVADVRLMHTVAMARRRLRFENGALALNAVKLTFQLDKDGQTPLLTAPYPIKDSNRVVEEYMLLANYLVAQRLITHTGDCAVLRNHRPPEMEALGDLQSAVKTLTGMTIDISTSQSLHHSLVQLGHMNSLDAATAQTITQLSMEPMVPAMYFCSGTTNSKAEWRHFALNIPYYTHFTSPIRRYPDVMVHRLLQETLLSDVGEAESNNTNEVVSEISTLCGHCNGARMSAKKAQDQCDRLFLALYVKTHPQRHQVGLVTSVGDTVFTVYLPEFGETAKLYLEEHKDLLTYAKDETKTGAKRLLLQQKKTEQQQQQQERKEMQWGTLEIVLTTRLLVTILCTTEPPMDIKLRLEGPGPV